MRRLIRFMQRESPIKEVNTRTKASSSGAELSTAVRYVVVRPETRDDSELAVAEEEAFATKAELLASL